MKCATMTMIRVSLRGMSGGDYPAAIAEEHEALVAEVDRQAFQLEYQRHGTSEHGKVVDQFGHVNQKTSRPLYFPLDEWRALEHSRRARAAATGGG